jgi:hypothetical protein
LSEKVDKTYVDNSIAELVDGAPETLDTLNELAAALNDNADIVDVLNQSISNKQDAITDLETIRQGAAKGATALQSYTEQYKGTVTGVKINGTTKNPSSGVVDLGTVITAHQDISGKQDNLVSGTNIKTINGESILGDGDLSIQSANIVTLDIGSLPTQNSSVAVNFTEDQLQILRLEDTVIKITFNHLGKPHVCTMFHTIPGVTHVYSGVAYTVKNSAVYDTNKRYIYGQFGHTSNTITFTIGDIIITESDVKTINGQSLIGSGDITISGGSSSGSGAYSEVNHGTSDTTFTLTPNTFHVWDEVANLTLTLGSETAGVANEYLFQFTSGATATTLSLPSDLKWANDAAPTIAENMIYQVSILKGLASVLEFSNAPRIIHFYIIAMGQTFQYNCRKNTTWSEFVDSEFNNGTYKLEIKDGGVCVHGPIANMYFPITGQTPSDIIEESVTYTTS